MKVERNRAGNRYTFTPEDEKDEKFLDIIGKLEEENKKLKEELENTKKEFEQYKQNYNIEKDKQTIFLMTGRRY